jgi:hypothetical protein
METSGGFAPQHKGSAGFLQAIQNNIQTAAIRCNFLLFMLGLKSS